MANLEIKVDLNDTQAIAALKALNAKVTDTGKKTKKSFEGMGAASSVFVGNLAAIAASKAFDYLRTQVIDSFRTFQEFEAGLIGVAKTANLTDKEVKQLGKAVLDISKDVPAGTEELLSIGVAAGQLGVTGVGNIAKFSDTIAKLGRVSDIEGEEAAKTLTRILNTSQESVGTIDTLSSVIVSLGNSFAASESEIVSITGEITRASAQFGVSSHEAAALGTALRATGVRAEEAGGVMSKAFIQINSAIQKGGKPLERLSELTGIAAENLQKEFGENAIGVFQKMVAGLNNLDGGIKNASFALADMGIEGIRVNKVLPTLARNSEDFERALQLANAEVVNATALQTEFQKSLESSKSKTQLLDNAIERAKIRLAEQYAPAVNAVTVALTEYIDTIGKADTEIWADEIDDVGRLERSIAQLNKTAEKARLNDDQFLIDKTNEDIKILKERLKEVNEVQLGNNISALKAELKSLEEIPAVGLSIYGSPEAAAARQQEIIEQLNAYEQAAIMSGERIVEAKKTQDATKLDNDLTAETTRLTALQELQAVYKEQERADEAAAKMGKTLEREEDFQELSSLLGRKEAERRLYTASNIEDAKKRKKALQDIREDAEKKRRKFEEENKKWDDLTAKEKVELVQTTLGQISSLTQSSNETLFRVGQVSNIAQATMSTYTAATNAYRDVPYPFNIAASALVAAAGFANVSKIASQKPPKYANGGIMEGNDFQGDQRLARVNSGEMMLNRRQQNNMFQAIDRGNLGGGGNTFNFYNPVLLDDSGIDKVIDGINDRVEFGNKELKVS